MLTATEMILAHSGQGITRAQARELATLARALAVLKDPGAADLLEFAKEAEKAARGRPAAPPKRTGEPPAQRPPRPAFDDRPLEAVDPSFWGVMRPTMMCGGRPAPQLGKGEDPAAPEDGIVWRAKAQSRSLPWEPDLEPRRAMSAYLADLGGGFSFRWLRRQVARRPELEPLASRVRARYQPRINAHLGRVQPCQQGISHGHQRGYWCGHMLGAQRAVELNAQTAARRWAFYDAKAGRIVSCDYDAADISAELEGAAMKRLELFGAVYVGAAPRGRRLNGSQRDRRNLKPGGQRLAKTARRVSRENGRLALERAVANRAPSERQVQKALALAAKYALPIEQRQSQPLRGGGGGHKQAGAERRISKALEIAAKYATV